MLTPVRTVAPTEAPVSLAEAKLQLRVDHSVDDTLIERLIEAATAHLDGWSGLLGRCLVTQTWRVSFGEWPCDSILRLPFPDVESVTLTYRDTDDAEQTVSGALYELLEDERSAYLRLRSSFTSPTLYDDRSDAVQATIVAGYGDAEDVPQGLRHAILLYVGAWYENREETAIGVSVASLPESVATRALIAPHRRIGV